MPKADIEKYTATARAVERFVDQVVEVPVPMTQEESVHVPTIMQQKRIQQQKVEMIVEEEIVHVPMLTVQHRIGEVPQADGHEGHDGAEGHEGLEDRCREGHEGHAAADGHEGL